MHTANYFKKYIIAHITLFALRRNPITYGCSLKQNGHYGSRNIDVYVFPLESVPRCVQSSSLFTLLAVGRSQGASFPCADVFAPQR